MSLLQIETTKTTIIDGGQLLRLVEVGACNYPVV